MASLRKQAEKIVRDGLCGSCDAPGCICDDFQKDVEAQLKEWAIEDTAREIEVCTENIVPTFEKELENLINKHSKENESNTPDFILAQFLLGCLKVFNQATQQRENWYGRDPRPTSESTTAKVPEIPVKNGE